MGVGSPDSASGSISTAAAQPDQVGDPLPMITLSEFSSSAVFWGGYDVAEGAKGHVGAASRRAIQSGPNPNFPTGPDASRTGASKTRSRPPICEGLLYQRTGCRHEAQ